MDTASCAVPTVLSPIGHRAVLEAATMFPMVFPNRMFQLGYPPGRRVTLWAPCTGRSHVKLNLRKNAHKFARATCLYSARISCERTSRLATLTAVHHD